MPTIDKDSCLQSLADLNDYVKKAKGCFDESAMAFVRVEIERASFPRVVLSGPKRPADLILFAELTGAKWYTYFFVQDAILDLDDGQDDLYDDEPKLEIVGASFIWVGNGCLYSYSVFLRSYQDYKDARERRYENEDAEESHKRRRIQKWSAERLAPLVESLRSDHRFRSVGTGHAALGMDLLHTKYATDVDKDMVQEGLNLGMANIFERAVIEAARSVKATAMTIYVDMYSDEDAFIHALDTASVPWRGLSVSKRREVLKKFLMESSGNYRVPNDDMDIFMAYTA